MKPDDLLKQKRAEILRAMELYGARNVRIFGSVARGKAECALDYAGLDGVLNLFV